MSEKNNSSEIIPSPQSGMIHNLVIRAKLVLRLLADPRVSNWVKLIPIGAIIYIISPVDLIMGVPGLDALDDAAVAGLGYYFFIELCPPNIVQEHLKALSGTTSNKDSDDVVDAETTEVDDKPK